MTESEWLEATDPPADAGVAAPGGEGERAEAPAVRLRLLSSHLAPDCGRAEPLRGRGGRAIRGRPDDLPGASGRQRGRLDCYRYTLTQLGVRACLSAPASLAHLEDNLAALRDPALPDERRDYLLSFGSSLYDEETVFRKFVRNVGCGRIERNETPPTASYLPPVGQPTRRSLPVRGLCRR